MKKISITAGKQITEVDKQMAAPAETRTPNLHRANQSAPIDECGWKGGDSGNSAENKPRDQQIPKRIPLTPTGLLMEGDYTNHRAMIDHDVTPTELDVKLVLAVYSSNSTSSPSEDFRRFPGSLSSLLVPRGMLQQPRWGLPPQRIPLFRRNHRRDRDGLVCISGRIE